MKIQAIICPHCKATIYSRCRHDFRWCPCKKTAIDGGFDYQRVSYTEILPQNIEIEVEVNIQDLYKDWSEKINKYGIIEKEQLNG